MKINEDYKPANIEFNVSKDGTNIPESEKTDIWNQMAANEEFIDKTFTPKEEKKGKK